MTPPSDQSVGPGAVLFFYFQRGVSSLVLFKPFPSGEGGPKGWLSPKPSPWGEGGWPLGQTDEGTDFGLGSLDTERFRRHLRAKSRPSGGCAPKRACGRSRRRGTFPAMGKYPKDRRGTAQNGHFVSIFALPPDPHNGGRVPVAGSRISGAQNLSGGRDLFRPTGGWLSKN